MTDIAGATVLITGAASGIGRLLAERAAPAGASLVLWDINRERLDQFAATLRANGARAVHTIAADVSDRAAVHAAAEEVGRSAGPIDILINNAGIVSGHLLLESSDERIIATFGVNTLALYWMTKAFLPEMVRRDRGHVVTIASAAGLVGVRRQTDYSASKHAAVGFDESLRYELRKQAPHVVTTVICPYYIDTGMFHGVRSRFPWLLPILSETYVVDRIMRAIRRNERRVMIPRIVATLPVLRLLPVPIFDRVIDLLGINVGMDEFVGRSPR